MQEIAIIGAGVVGRVASLMCLEQGLNVKLYDESGLLNNKSASFVAGGMISAISELDHAPAQILNYQAFALKFWTKIAEKIDIDLKIEDTLILSHQQDKSELDFIKKKIIQYGLSVNSNIFPLGYIGFSIQGEAYLNPKKFYQASNVFFEQHPNFQFIQKRVNPYSDFTDKKLFVLDCRGIGAISDLKHLNPRGIRGEIIDLYAPNACTKSLVRLYHPRYPLYIIPRGQGHFSLGASFIEASDDSNISVRSCLEILTTALSFDKGFLEARINHLFTAIRPSFNSSLPIIFSKENISSINGMCRNGYLFAPLTIKKFLEEKNVYYS